MTNYYALEIIFENQQDYLKSDSDNLINCIYEYLDGQKKMDDRFIIYDATQKSLRIDVVTFDTYDILKDFNDAIIDRAEYYKEPIKINALDVECEDFKEDFITMFMKLDIIKRAESIDYFKLLQSKADERRESLDIVFWLIEDFDPRIEKMPMYIQKMS